MQDSPSPALRPPISNTAIFIRRNAAVVLLVVVGDVGVATDTGGREVCTNVPAHKVIVVIGTLHAVVADDLTLGIGGVGGTVLGTLVVTCICSWHWLASAAGVFSIVFSAPVPGIGAAVGGTVLAQGDVAAGA